MCIRDRLIPAPPVRQDTYPKKRVELHMHTKMSAMDAVSSVGSLVDRAAYWGHPAVAITDHGVAQGFPDARKAAKAHKGLKMIYGMEGYLIDDIDSKRLNDIRAVSYTHLDVYKRQHYFRLRVRGQKSDNFNSGVSGSA